MHLSCQGPICCVFTSSGFTTIEGGSGLMAAAAKLLQSCLTLCDPIDGSPPGSPVPGILQARTLEWVAISFSNASKWKVKVKSLSHVGLLATPWTAAFQAPPSMGFARQEYRSGVPLPFPLMAARWHVFFSFLSSLRAHCWLVAVIAGDCDMLCLRKLTYVSAPGWHAVINKRCISVNVGPRIFPTLI